MIRVHNRIDLNCFLQALLCDVIKVNLCLELNVSIFESPSILVGNKGYAFFEKDKDNILVYNILAILLEDFFRQLILQRIRLKDILRYSRIRIRIWILGGFVKFMQGLKFFTVLSSGSINQNFTLVGYIKSFHNC